MWVRDNDKYEAKEFLIETAKELIENMDDIDVIYDLPGMRIPQDTHVTIRLLNNTLAVAQEFKSKIAEMVSRSEQFVIKETIADDGERYVDLIFSVFNVETFDPNLHATTEDLREVGLL